MGIEPTGEGAAEPLKQAVYRDCSCPVWESNPNGWLFKAYKIRRFVIQRNLLAIGVRIFAL
jgi:hypothetical protein